MAEWIITTEADARYAPLLEGLLASIGAAGAGRGAAVGVLDIGLEAPQRERLRAQGIAVRDPGLSYDFSHYKAPPPAYARALTAFPFLPRLFPGYALYLHLDSDTWIQDWSAVELCLASARESGFAVTPEIDRCYRPKIGNLSIDEFMYRCLRYCFNEASTRFLMQFPMINSGVFAARADAPHWRVWGDLLGQIVAQKNEYYFYAEQAAMHATMWSRELEAALLPAWCNWLCQRALPMCSEDGRVLTEPQPPYRPLGIVHLAGATQKNGRWPLKDRKGAIHTRSLRYGGDAAGEFPEIPVEIPADINWGGLAWSDLRRRAPEPAPAADRPR